MISVDFSSALHPLVLHLRTLSPREKMLVHVMDIYTMGMGGVKTVKPAKGFLVL